MRLSHRARRWVTAAAVTTFAAVLVSGCGGGADDAGSSEAASTASWCELGERIAEQDLVLAATDLSNPADIERSFSSLRSVYDSALDAAPAEIRADVEIVKGAFDDLYAALESVEFDLVALDDVDFEVFDAEVDAAGTRIERYGVEQCGFVDLESGEYEPPSGSLTEAEMDELLSDEEFLATIRDDLVTLFAADGYSPEQAECLADVFDVEVFMQLETDDALVDETRAAIIACGVDPAELDELVADG